MNKNKCLIYDYNTVITNIEDEEALAFTYYFFYHKLEVDLKDVLADYEGKCFVRMDFSNFEVKELGELVEDSRPHYHLMICGDKLEFIENKVDDYFSNNFISGTFKKIHMDAYPFNEEEEELDTRCYQSDIYLLNKDKPYIKMI